MRWMLTLVMLPVLAWPAAAQENEAEKWFRSMEKKLAAAKSMAVELHMKSEGSDLALDFRGTVLIAPGNKMKLALSGKNNEGGLKFTAVSDGKTLVVAKAQGLEPDSKADPANSNLTKLLGGVLGRVGLLVGLDDVLRLGKADLSLDAFKVSDFKLGDKVAVNGRQAQLLEYTVGMPKSKDTATCKLWLDVATHLPLKREIVSNKRKGVFVETYSQWQLDPKVDDKEFVLPK